MKRIAALTVAVAVLVFTGSALAGSKTIRQSGQVVGDKAATVELRVKVKNGEPIKVSGFKADKIFTRCEDQIVRFEYTALDPLPVVDDKFKIKLEGSGGAVLKVQGTVKNGGKATKGSLKTNEFTASNDAICKTPKQRFKTSS